MFDFGGAFGLYAMECEKRSEKIEAAIQELRRKPNPNDPVVREAVFAQCGLTDLTDSEIAFIGRNV